MTTGQFESLKYQARSAAYGPTDSSVLDILQALITIVQLQNDRIARLEDDRERQEDSNIQQSESN